MSIVLSRLRLTFGLRDYGTAQWDGGDKDCQHIAERSIGASTLMNDGRPNPGILAHHKVPGVPYRSVCGKCGARRIDAQIGLEATPDEYIAQMVAVFREVRRVLRADGTLWLNLGDSYNNFRSQMGPGQGLHGRDDLRGKREPQSGSRGWWR